MNEESNRIMSLNMTNFFKRELFMYSFGDIKFKKPIALKTLAFTVGFLLIWVIPLMLIFGIPMNPIAAILYFGPPIALGQVASRPIFGGKTLIDFVKTAILYLGEPKGWADLKPFNASKSQQTYSIEHEIWISRRREYAMLAEMIDATPIEEREAILRGSSAKAKNKSKAKTKKKAKLKR